MLYQLSYTPRPCRGIWQQTGKIKREFNDYPYRRAKAFGTRL